MQNYRPAMSFDEETAAVYDDVQRGDEQATVEYSARLALTDIFLYTVRQAGAVFDCISPPKGGVFQKQPRTCMRNRSVQRFMVRARCGRARFPGSRTPAAEEGMKLVAVNERAWSPDVLREALTAAKNSTDPIQLLVENAGSFKTHTVEYHGGNRYPHLVRGDGPDILSDIIRQHAGLP